MYATDTTTATKRLLKDEAYDRIKRMIIEGELRPGELLSERKLGKALGISGSPVRAAIERLGMNGLVSISPQRGTFVLDLSSSEIAEQFEFRMVLEAHIAGRLAGELMDLQVKQFNQQLDKQRKCASMIRMQDKIMRVGLAVNCQHENRLPDSIDLSA